MNTIKLKLGNEYDISVKENVTTGYEWQYSVDNPLIVSLNKESVATADSNQLGAANKTSFKLKGLSKGKTKIHLVHKRVWESTAIETKEYTVIVK